MILASVCLAGGAAGRDILVPQETNSISQALKLAERDDRVLISAGHYYATDLNLVDGVTIEGNADDPGSVVIDAQSQGRVFRAESVFNVKIVGITITGGAALGETNYSGSGGGLFVSSSGVDLEHIVFSSNVASASGGAVVGASIGTALMPVIGTGMGTITGALAGALRPHDQQACGGSHRRSPS